MHGSFTIDDCTIECPNCHQWQLYWEQEEPCINCGEAVPIAVWDQRWSEMDEAEFNYSPPLDITLGTIYQAASCQPCAKRGTFACPKLHVWNELFEPDFYESIRTGCSLYEPN